MNKIHRWIVLSALIAASGGCSHKNDAVSELEKAANVLARDEPAPAPTPAASQPSPTSELQPPSHPAQELREALAAYKSGQLEDAVTRLHKVRSTAVITPQQRMVLQDSIAAVMSEVYTLAAQGDTRAIAAVKQYERMQTTPH